MGQGQKDDDDEAGRYDTLYLVTELQKTIDFIFQLANAWSQD